MATPGPKGRLSGIPTPGKTSSIPTPGRYRSVSNAQNYPPPLNHDEDFAAKAFADAIKAHDPSLHRTSESSSSLSASFAPSGRRSVAGRSSSAASAASSAGPSHSRTSDIGLNSSIARPASRASDVFGRSASRAGRPFDVGDFCRIESLGCEGIVRYIGEIDGKPGLFAGVELQGGFVGHGKNDGSVNGKQYFVCPPKCGVFAAMSKLSPPTAGSVSRPASVASVRNGRVTPSVSGRITPSSSISLPNTRKTPSRALSNGRITPSVHGGRNTPAASAGRRTPGLPAAVSKTRTVPTYTPKAPAITPTRSYAGNQANITPGSRASRYVNMTASQLNSSKRDPGADSPTRKSIGGSASPTRSLGMASPIQLSSLHLPSPTRSTGSPFNTPKAGRISGLGVGLPSSASPGKSRPSLSTPKARIPSAVAMPPPASPSLSSRSVSGGDEHYRTNGINGDHSDPGSVSAIAANGFALSQSIAELLSKSRSSSDQSKTSRPSSSASVRSHSQPNSAALSLELQNQLEVLQARLDASENENQRLRNSAEKADEQISTRLQTITEERDKFSSRVTDLESSLRAAERLAKEKEAAVETLERAVQQSVLDVEKVKSDGEARLRDTQSKLEDKEALVSQLKEFVDTKEGEQSQNDALVASKNAEISLLEARVQKAYAELEEERRELGAQVEELRKAGQETIALYEERLSVADSRRYEMEDAIALLEEQVKASARPPSPGTATRQASTAAQIENEMLRDQLQHAQERVTNLTEELGNAQEAVEIQENAWRDRTRKYKDREETMRKEVVESRKEVDNVLKAEQLARNRVEEIEEALRENTVALENARAEIEGLRNEIANLEGLVGADGAQRAADDRQLLKEVSRLKQELAETRERSTDDSESSALQASKSALEEYLAEERQLVFELRQQLDERTSELEAAKKRLNREMPINGLVPETAKPAPPSPSRQDSAAKDEIKGLKHIIQEMQKEIGAISQQNKTLESENKLLLSETDQLREEMKILEDSVEQSILREEQALDAMGSPTATDDVATLKQNVKDIKAKHEREIEQLQKRLNEQDRTRDRKIHELNKDIGELESLIEAKIYREDELEQKIKQLETQLTRYQKKSSRSSAASELPASASDRSDVKLKVQSEGEVCEMCEQPGHDIFNCDLLKEDVAAERAREQAHARDELFCTDCEEHGHLATDCPHSMDVF